MFGLTVLETMDTETRMMIADTTTTDAVMITAIINKRNWCIKKASPNFGMLFLCLFFSDLCMNKNFCFLQSRF